MICIVFNVHCQQDCVFPLRKNKAICPGSPQFWACSKILVKMKSLKKIYDGGGLAYSWLQSRSWTWLHLILLFHFLLGLPPYSLLIERSNLCCPLSTIWFNATDMINVLLNLLPVSLIRVLKESGLVTKCHSSKCHVSLSLFVILYVS